MVIRTQLTITVFTIPNNFSFNNIAKKSFPGTPLGQVPSPWSPRSMDFTKMVMVIQRYFTINVFTIPNYIAK